MWLQKKSFFLGQRRWYRLQLERIFLGFLPKLKWWSHFNNISFMLRKCLENLEILLCPSYSYVGPDVNH